MTKIKNIIIHCSASDFGDVELIRHWHVDERKWRDIGYNGVILNGYREKGKFNKTEIGKFEIGRGLDLDEYVDSHEKGAHALGYNASSLGLCLIGSKKFYVTQFQTALYFCALFEKINPDIRVLAHNEVSDKKTCPNFDISLFRALLKNRDFIDSEIRMVMQDYIFERD